MNQEQSSKRIEKAVYVDCDLVEAIVDGGSLIFSLINNGETVAAAAGGRNRAAVIRGQRLSLCRDTFCKNFA